MRMILAALLFLASAAPAAAQRPFEPGPSPEDARYEMDRAELARVLGGAHYLRTMCVDRGDQTWRRAMLDLLDTETPVGSPERSALASAFNAGFRDQEVRHYSCTEEARAAEAMLREEGAKLADAMRARNSD